jgi:predicted ABC-type exoprotein transport system permease subunit
MGRIRVLFLVFVALLLVGPVYADVMVRTEKGQTVYILSEEDMKDFVRMAAIASDVLTAFMQTMQQLYMVAMQAGGWGAQFGEILQAALERQKGALQAFVQAHPGMFEESPE